MGISLHNHFDLEVIDSRTGQKKSSAHAENVVTNSWYHEVFYSFSGQNAGCTGIGVALGSGTGTPAVTDKSLFNYVFGGGCDENHTSYITPSSNTVEQLLDDNNKLIGYKATRVWVFPANSSYIGTLTEVGLTVRTPTGTLRSHAMLKDAEGNEIAIKKTDLDILTVTVTFYLTVSMQWTNPIEYSPKFIYWLAYIFGIISTENSNIKGYGNGDGRDIIRYISFVGCLAGSMQVDDSTSFYGPQAVLAGSLEPACNSSVLSYAESDSSCINGVSVSCSSARLGTEASNNWVINGLSYTIGQRGEISNIYYHPSLFLPFPNEDVFPAIPLSDLQVGVGDGSTTEFAPAVPLFVEGSDKVYVNGVEQVRGVDYTVENNGTGRFDCSPGTLITNLKNDPASIVITDPNNRYNQYGYAIVPFCQQSRADIKYCKLATWSIASPLEFELRDDPTICHKVNSIKVPSFTYDMYHFSASDDVYFILEYSTDKETWQEVLRIAIYDYVNNQRNLTYTFDTIEAKYWRIRSELVSGNEPTAAQLTSGIAISSYVAYKNYNNPSYMLYKGHGIVFTNPPAEGDIITMDATIDRPYKTANNVLDVAFQFKIVADLQG